ncbi:MAG: hypothetical protein Q8896_14050, partial [Bacteroidota bacterium]|nr:hypothetical protein [Bacteroidota bacterium]
RNLPAIMPEESPGWISSDTAPTEDGSGDKNVPSQWPIGGFDPEKLTEYHFLSLNRESASLRARESYCVETVGRAMIEPASLLKSKRRREKRRIGKNLMTKAKTQYIQ